MRRGERDLVRVDGVIRSFALEDTLEAGEALRASLSDLQELWEQRSEDRSHEWRKTLETAYSGIRDAAQARNGRRS